MWKDIDLHHVVVVVLLVLNSWRRRHIGMFTFLLEDLPWLALATCTASLLGVAAAAARPCYRRRCLSAVIGTSKVLEDAGCVCLVAWLCVGCFCGRARCVESIQVTFMESHGTSQPAAAPHQHLLRRFYSNCCKLVFYHVRQTLDILSCCCGWNVSSDPLVANGVGQLNENHSWFIVWFIGSGAAKEPKCPFKWTCSLFVSVGEVVACRLRRWILVADG